MTYKWYSITYKWYSVEDSLVRTTASWCARSVLRVWWPRMVDCISTAAFSCSLCKSSWAHASSCCLFRSAIPDPLASSFHTSGTLSCSKPWVCFRICTKTSTHTLIWYYVMLESLPKRIDTRQCVTRLGSNPFSRRLAPEFQYLLVNGNIFCLGSGKALMWVLPIIFHAHFFPTGNMDLAKHEFFDAHTGSACYRWVQYSIHLCVSFDTCPATKLCFSNLENPRIFSQFGTCK